MTAPRPIADGMYFNLPEAEYHADPALGGGDVRNLLISPLTYWVNSYMSDWPGKESEAMTNGSAFHMRIVEGAERFADRYAVKPDKDDYPEALDGTATLKAWLRDHDIKVSGAIPELCERIREADPDVVLWPDIIADFEDEAEGKIRLSQDVAMQIAFRAGIIDRHPAAQKAFNGGYPEVSIFWTDPETGIRCKERIDYLKTKAVVELKTFSNQFDKPLDAAVMNAIAQRRYHISAAMYLEGVEQAKRLIRENAEFIYDDAPHNWLTEFMAGDHAYVFVFIETGRVPNVILREYRTHHRKDVVNHYWVSGHQHFRDALEIYRQCIQTFGEDPWIQPEPMKPLEDEQFPIWME